jgi:polyisoprenoid-binding protein YceI
MTNKIAVGIFFLLLIVGGQAFAGTVIANPGQSSILFRINHDLGYTVGYFKNFTATLEVNDDQTQVLSSKIQVQTASINSRNSIRDEGLKSGLFLETEKFPQATFESTKIEGDQMSGLLTIKGIAKPMTFKIQQDQAKKTIILKGAFNRNDYKITYNHLMANKKKSIGDTVELILELNAQ